VELHDGVSMASVAFASIESFGNVRKEGNSNDKRQNDVSTHQNYIHILVNCGCVETLISEIVNFT
jgi:hypothetical protein